MGPDQVTRGRYECVEEFCQIFELLDPWSGHFSGGNRAKSGILARMKAVGEEQGRKATRLGIGGSVGECHAMPKLP